MTALINHDCGVIIIQDTQITHIDLFTEKTTKNDLLAKARQKYAGAKENIPTPAQLHALRPKIPSNLLVERALAETIASIRNAVKKDVLVIQTIKAHDDLTKQINALAKRLREWYSFYLPELSRRHDDIGVFVEKLLTFDKEQLLTELHVSREVSMGADLAKVDVDPIKDLARTISSMKQLQDHYEKYIDELMQSACPNLLSLTGPILGAKLLEAAGDLHRLSNLPSSTIQTLGAEKALFKHLSGAASSPKHGLLLQHPMVQKAPFNKRGKMARFLANKIAIAVRVDYFGGNTYEGITLKDQLEKRL